MGILEIISGVVLATASVVIILLVLAQESKSGGMGALTGGSDAFATMQSRSVNAKAAVVTKYAAIVFFIAALVVSAIAVFTK